jgi:hypothetical protein
LKLDWCTHKAIVYACKNWHYSRSVPTGKLVKIGVWEDKKFVGGVIFSRGATPMIGRPYRLNQTQICELTRIALNTHKTPVTKIVSIAMSMLRKNYPTIQMVVSYADVDQGHEGKIYKAGNWKYEGKCNVGSRTGFIIHGKKVHNKTVHSKGIRQSLDDVRKYLDKNATEFVSKGKHKFVYKLR